jgi:CheY-like chemotaxis protein
MIKEFQPAGINVKALRGISALLVEDNPFYQFMARSMLEKFSMDVTIAADGLEAIEKLRTSHFNVILMDLQMPHLGGLDATRKIRNELKLDVPVIALTGITVEGVKDECVLAGMNDYIPKPFTPDILAKKILAVLKCKS